MNCATIGCDGPGCCAFYYGKDKTCIGLCRSCLSVWQSCNGGKHVGLNAPQMHPRVLKLMLLKAAIASGIRHAVDDTDDTLCDIRFVLRDLLAYLKTRIYDESTCKCYEIAPSAKYVPTPVSEYAKYLRLLMEQKNFNNLRAAATYIGITPERLKERLGEYVKDFKK